MTPGPWVQQFAGGVHVIRSVACSRSLAQVLHDGPEDEANAQAMTAAPELLNACTLAVMMLGVEAQMHRENQAPKKAEAVEKAIAVIRAAIAKAEGTAAPHA